jgi:threonine/homoserine efflux transporter RhtA
MMTAGLQVVLLGFATIGFAGTGASLAVARGRSRMDGERDAGMLAVAAMLFVFGVLCTLASSGVSGVLAFGSVVLWIGYVVTAQRLGMFRIETAAFPAEATEAEPQQRT